MSRRTWLVSVIAFIAVWILILVFANSHDQDGAVAAAQLLALADRVDLP
jgi:uncharacterized protein YggT (Ycf19 family)